MAKVVLVWNEHPTEVVAGLHARKVAKILREKYGHEVVVKKIPAKETIYGVLDIRDSAKAAWHIRNRRSSLDITKEIAERHHAPAFNFHATSAIKVAEANKYKPDKFRIGEKELAESPMMNREIEFIHKRGEKDNLVVEMPGFETNLPARILKKRWPRLEAIVEDERISPALKEKVEDYLLRYMPLRHPRQQKFLHPAISEKIAAAIHERITQRKPH